MTIKLRIRLAIILWISAGIVGYLKFGAEGRQMLQSDIPWVLLCMALGFSGTLLLFSVIFTAINQSTKLFKTKTPPSLSLFWLFWLFMFIVDLIQVIGEYHDPAVTGIESLTNYMVIYIVSLLTLLVGFIVYRARKIGWIQALSLYAVDKHSDEREREIQYQATGITFTMLLIALVAISLVLGTNPPTYQGAYVTLFSTVFFGAMALRGCITWLLAKR